MFSSTPCKRRERIAQLAGQGPDAGALVEHHLAAHARQGALGVVGDGEDPIAAGPGGGHHLLQRGAAVARDGRVQVKVADHVGQGAGQAAGLGGLDLAGVLAQHRRDEGQPQGGVDLLLGLAGHHRRRPRSGAEGVFVEGQVAGQGPLPQLDVVPLGPREVEAGGAELVGGHDAHVDLGAPAGHHAGLGRTAHQHPVDEAHARPARPSPARAPPPPPRCRRRPIVSEKRRSEPQYEAWLTPGRAAS